MQTRVIAGSQKGKRLINPKKGTRPLMDRIKTSLFDLISDFIPDAEVLDLYAGGGNFGIEALSRGASYATFIDIGRESIQCIETNLDNTGFTDKADIIQQQVEDYVRRTDSKFDIIMTDPPFDNVIIEHIKDAAKLIKPDGLFIFRSPEGFEAPRNIENLKIVYEKKYGKSNVSFYQMA